MSGESAAAKRQGEMSATLAADTSIPCARSSWPASLAGRLSNSTPDITGLNARVLKPAARQWRSNAHDSHVLPMSVPVPVIK